VPQDRIKEQAPNRRIIVRQLRLIPKLPQHLETGNIWWLANWVVLSIFILFNCYVLYQPNTYFIFQQQKVIMII